MASQSLIPKGATLLLTGGTGLVGSAIAKHVIEQGYRVRITTRQPEKAKPLVELLQSLFPNAPPVEVYQVEDISADNAFDEAIKGVSGVFHVATDSSWSTDVDALVKGTEKATTTLMKAAAKEISVKSFVLTSSRVVLFHPSHDQEVVAAGLDEFRDDLAKLAYSLPEEHPKKADMAYIASKVRGEQAAWKYYKEAQPQYQFATILPDLVAGEIVNPAPGVYSTATWFQWIFQGNADPSRNPAMGFVDPASMIIDSRDLAAIQLAALLDPQAAGQRYFVASHQYELNEVLAIWRKAYPENNKIPADFSIKRAPRNTVDNQPALKLLQKWTGSQNFYSTEETMLKLVENVRY